ncbi:MAG TPA: TadE family protein [Mobilitalea sp.]|nr:TadE family protein [Mobilitalea sp.]
MKKKIKGSFTVEATLLMPIVLFVIISLIYLSFYLHDKSRIEGTVDKALLKASMTLKHEADIETGAVNYEGINNRGVFYLLMGSTNAMEKDIQTFLEQELSGGLLSTEITKVIVTAGKLKVSIDVEGEFEIPIKGVRDYFNPNPKLVIKVNCPIHNPAEILRISEVILDTGKKIKGMEALKEKLDKLLN